jgi:predicted phosphodiesterase
MRYALFSDIHGNLTGLKAVLAAIPVLGGADILIAAGDHLWGESATDEILDLLAAHHVHMVRGDSDTEDKLERLEQEALRAPGTTTSSLGYYRGMRAWLRAHLSDAGRELLASLPLSLTFEAAPGQRLYVCHASPRGVGDPVCSPQLGPATVREAYRRIEADVIAFGHWHIPYVRLLDGRLYLNVASVGFRRDGLSRLTMLTHLDDQWVVEQHSVPYDVAAEERRKRERQVPQG